jgi:hypothetical protein
VIFELLALDIFVGLEADDGFDEDAKLYFKVKLNFKTK